MTGTNRRQDHPRWRVHVRVPKTAELVAAHLRAQIVRGELQDGDALPPEMELVQRYGISRPDAAGGVPRPRVGVADQRPARRPRRRARASPDARCRGPQRGSRAPAPRHHHGGHLPGPNGHRGAVRRPARSAPHQSRPRPALDEGRGGRGRHRRARPVHPTAHRVPRPHRGPRRQPDAGAAQRHGAPHHRPGQLDPRRPRSRRHHPEGVPPWGQGPPPPRRAHRRQGLRRGRGACGAPTSSRPASSSPRTPDRRPSSRFSAEGQYGGHRSTGAAAPAASARARARSALPLGERGISSTKTTRRGAL